MTDKIIEFYIEDDVLYKSEPMPAHKNIHHNILIITKEAFIACYKKWIEKGERNE